MITIINKELQLLDEWFRVNRLSLNIDKTNFIVFHTSRKTIPQMQNEININGVNIKQVVTSKFLGVILDEHLTWAPHIKVTASKIAKNIGIIRKIAYLLPKKTLVGLYHTMVSPYFTYGNIIWASNYKARTNCLFLLQKRALRVVTKDTYYAHTETKFQELGVLKFDHVNDYLIGNFYFKLTNNTLTSFFDDYCRRIHEVHQHCTRASAGLSVPYARTNYRKFALKCRGPLVWNMIPINIREQKSFYSFKTQWKEYIMGNQGGS